MLTRISAGVGDHPCKVVLTIESVIGSATDKAKSWISVIGNLQANADKLPVLVHALFQSMRWPRYAIVFVIPIVVAVF